MFLIAVYTSSRYGDNASLTTIQRTMTYHVCNARKQIRRQQGSMHDEMHDESDNYLQYEGIWFDLSKECHATNVLSVTDSVSLCSVSCLLLQCTSLWNLRERLRERCVTWWRATVETHGNNSWRWQTEEMIQWGVVCVMCIPCDIVVADYHMSYWENRDTYDNTNICTSWMEMAWCIHLLIVSTRMPIAMLYFSQCCTHFFATSLYTPRLSTSAPKGEHCRRWAMDCGVVQHSHKTWIDTKRCVSVTTEVFSVCHEGNMKEQSDDCNKIMRG